MRAILDIAGCLATTHNILVALPGVTTKNVSWCGKQNHRNLKTTALDTHFWQVVEYMGLESRRRVSDKDMFCGLLAPGM